MKTAVVICPGRGTYNKSELGYLTRHFPDHGLLAAFDAQRRGRDQQTLAELDQSAAFSPALHTRGDHAAALIYAASLGDFLSIARDRIEILAVTGNSMGWYTALACGGALSAENGFNVANTMGTLMQRALIGGQLIYPSVDEDWRPQPERRKRLVALVEEINARTDHVLSLSIDLGGMLVLAGDEAGLAAFEGGVEPVQGRFPMRLSNHAAFHSALQAPVAEEGRRLLLPTLFEQPELPLIDGRGAIWWPGANTPKDLWEYTLGAQVIESYDFARAIAIAAREFAPDLFIVTGPGSTLGGAVAQSLILACWRGMMSKEDFVHRQKNELLLISMAAHEQRAVVI